MQKEELAKALRLYLITFVLKISFFKYNCTKYNNFLDNIFQKRQNNI